jgi:hypothetical protein
MYLSTFWATFRQLYLVTLFGAQVPWLPKTQFFWKGACTQKTRSPSSGLQTLIRASKKIRFISRQCKDCLRQFGTVRVHYRWSAYASLRKCFKPKLLGSSPMYTWHDHSWPRCTRSVGSRADVNGGQCDQTFCWKSAQFCPNIAQNRAKVCKNFCPKIFLVKIWEL